MLRATSLMICGLDERIVECTHVMCFNLGTPLTNGSLWHFVYTANIIPDSELWGILGFTTFRLMRGILCTVSDTVVSGGLGFRNPQDGTISAGWTHTVRCEITISGHMVMPCADLKLADDYQTARAAPVSEGQSPYYHLESISVGSTWSPPRLPILREQKPSQFSDFLRGISEEFSSPSDGCSSDHP